MSRRSQTATTQRRMIDRKLQGFSRQPTPQHGWIRAVRESLGLSAAQLAARAGIGTSTLLEIEGREQKEAVTIATLTRIARAMDCNLTYSIVPENAPTLDALLDSRALQAARRIIARTASSMALESQTVDARETDAQTELLAKSLKEQNARTLWEDE